MVRGSKPTNVLLNIVCVANSGGRTLDQRMHVKS